MITYLEQVLISFASHIHLFVFAPFASFVEEVIPVIPSPSIMIATGSIALSQGYVFHMIIVFALLGALGKTLGASVVYYVSGKVEDIFSGKMAKFFGITREQVETFGSRLGHGPRDYVVMTLLRAMPMVPSTLISVGGGLLKIRFRLFIISTFIGSTVRDCFYIYLGYAGTKALHNLFIKNSNSVEAIIQIVVVVILVIFLGYLYYRRKRAIL